MYSIQRLIRQMHRAATGAVLITIMTGISGTAWAALLTVDAAGGSGYTTIQAAINAAAVGDTIRVADGLYRENLVLNRSVIVESTSGAAATTIESPDAGTAVTITATHVTLDGFRIIGAKTGIQLSGGGNGLIKNNRIESAIYYSYGVLVIQQSNNNRFENNQIRGAHFGMFLTHNSNNNEILGGQVTACNFGIYASVLTGATIRGVEFNDNLWRGVYLESAMGVLIEENLFRGNQIGLMAGRANGNRAYHNNFIDNQTHAQVPRDLVLAKSYHQGGNYWSGLTGSDNNGDGLLDDPYQTGDATDPFPVTQPSGWEALTPLPFVRNLTTGQAYPGIQLALDAAYNGDEIVVDAVDPTAQTGLKAYYENVTVTQSVQVVGQNPDQSPLHALDRTAPIFAITADEVSIRGFALLESQTGVRLDGARNARLTELRIHSDRYYAYGILVINRSENALLQDNVIENQHFGVFITHNSNGTQVRGGAILGNRFGIYSSVYTGGEISDVVFNGNQWYGLYIESARDLLITENDFIDNNVGLSAGGGNHRIFHNNFITNQTQARGGYGSTWDDGYPSGGNHWSDWTAPDQLSGANQAQSGSDGFVDLAYALPPYTADRYPFVRESGWAITPEKLFAEIRTKIEALTRTTIPAPNDHAVEGWRNGLLGKLDEAEAFYRNGEVAAAVEKLEALAKKCDGLKKGGPDQIIDDPATPGDERQVIFDLIMTLTGLLAP